MTLKEKRAELSEINTARRELTDHAHKLSAQIRKLEAQEEVAAMSPEKRAALAEAAQMIAAESIESGEAMGTPGA